MVFGAIQNKQKAKQQEEDPPPATLPTKQQKIIYDTVIQCNASQRRTQQHNCF